MRRDGLCFFARLHLPVIRVAIVSFMLNHAIRLSEGPESGQHVRPTALGTPKPACQGDFLNRGFCELVSRLQYYCLQVPPGVTARVSRFAGLQSPPAELGLRDSVRSYSIAEALCQENHNLVVFNIQLLSFPMMQTMMRTIRNLDRLPL